VLRLHHFTTHLARGCASGLGPVRDIAVGWAAVPWLRSRRACPCLRPPPTRGPLLPGLLATLFLLRLDTLNTLLQPASCLLACNPNIYLIHRTGQRGLGAVDAAWMRRVLALGLISCRTGISCTKLPALASPPALLIFNGLPDFQLGRRVVSNQRRPLCFGAAGPGAMAPMHSLRPPPYADAHIASFYSLFSCRSGSHTPHKSDMALASRTTVAQAASASSARMAAPRVASSAAATPRAAAVARAAPGAAARLPAAALRQVRPARTPLLRPIFCARILKLCRCSRLCIAVVPGAACAGTVPPPPAPKPCLPAWRSGPHTQDLAPDRAFILRLLPPVPAIRPLTTTLCRRPIARP
jgi:hypothetical protein